MKNSNETRRRIRNITLALLATLWGWGCLEQQLPTENSTVSNIFEAEAMPASTPTTVISPEQPTVSSESTPLLTHLTFDTQVPEPVQCGSDDDCPGPFACVDGECRGCRANGVCALLGGVCDRDTNRCFQPDDCQYNGALCQAPTLHCVTNPDGGSHCIECMVDAHCPFGQTCHWDSESNVGFCESPLSCFAADRCEPCVETGECDPPPGIDCSIPTACSADAVCDLSSFSCIPFECDDDDMFARTQTDVGAAPIQPGTYEGLSICPRSVDRYVFAITEGSTVDIRIESEGGQVGAVLESPSPSLIGFPVRRADDHTRRLNLDAFPPTLVHEDSFAVLRVWSIGGIDAALYDLSLSVASQ